MVQIEPKHDNLVSVCQRRANPYIFYFILLFRFALY